MQNATFFPETLEVWLRVLFQTGVIAAAVAGILWRALMKPINGVGNRVNEVEANCKVHGSEIRSLERLQEQQAFQAASSSERLGRLETLIEKNTLAINNARETHHSEEGTVRERLVAIETRMDIFDELKTVLVALSDNLTRGSR